MALASLTRRTRPAYLAVVLCRARDIGKGTVAPLAGERPCVVHFATGKRRHAAINPSVLLEYLQLVVSHRMSRTQLTHTPCTLTRNALRLSIMVASPLYSLCKRKRTTVLSNRDQGQAVSQNTTKDGVREGIY